MKDLDFDELDRAVSSLMSNVPDKTNAASAPAASSAPAAPSAAVPPADGATPITVVNNSKPVEPPAPATPTPALAPAQRRGGRFMDMVPSQAKPRSASPPSREGVTITPRSESPASEPAVATEPTPAETPQVVKPSEPTSPASSSASSNWPDPLDMASPTDTPEPTPKAEPAPDTPATDAPTAQSGPLESPFLADAKVEKRPLNADSLELEKSSEEETPAEDKTSPSKTDNESLPPAPPVPAELNSDLIAIESNELVTDTASSEPFAGDKTEAAPDAKRLDEHSSGPIGPTSIVQQYKEQPSSGDKTHAAIFDASHYPEPLAHPAKKSSGWWWVVWVIILLAFGAGGAIVLYSLGII